MEINPLAQIREMYINPINEYLFNHVYVVAIVFGLVGFVLLINRIKEFILSRRSMDTEALYTCVWVTGEFYDSLSKNKRKI